TDAAHSGAPDEAGHRQGAAARGGPRGLAAHPGSRGHRQGRGHALSGCAISVCGGSMNDQTTIERVQALITRGPYHQWLGLKVLAVHDDGIELAATWREEWVVNPDRRYTHGGVIATLIDLAADWAI